MRRSSSVRRRRCSGSGCCSGPIWTREKIDSLLARQLPDAEKRRRADFVVDTGVSIEASNAALDAIIVRLRTWRGTAYQRCWA